jgi:hypothetical protein
VTSRIEALKGLLEKVESGEFGLHHMVHLFYPVFPDMDDDGTMASDFWVAYSEQSLDMALDFQKAVLPDAYTDFVQEYDGGWSWQITRDFHGSYIAEHAKPAIALLCATINALIAQEAAK